MRSRDLPFPPAFLFLPFLGDHCACLHFYFSHLWIGSSFIPSIEIGRGRERSLHSDPAADRHTAPSPFLRPAQAGVAAVALWWCQDLWVRPFSCGGAGMETSSVSTVTAGGSMASQPPSAGGDNARAPCPEVSLCVLFSISPSVCPNPWLFWPHSVVVVASINL